MKTKGKKSLTGLVEGKPCKKFGGKQQKSCLEPLTDQIERERVWNFLKKHWLKNSLYDFWLIELSFLKNPLYDFWLIEN